MPILPDTRVKKKNGLLRYRVIVNYTDANGKHVKVERLVWEKQKPKQWRGNSKMSTRTSAFPFRRK